MKVEDFLAGGGELHLRGSWIELQTAECTALRLPLCYLFSNDPDYKEVIEYYLGAVFELNSTYHKRKQAENTVELTKKALKDAEAVLKGLQVGCLS